MVTIAKNIVTADGNLWTVTNVAFKNKQTNKNWNAIILFSFVLFVAFLSFLGRETFENSTFLKFVSTTVFFSYSETFQIIVCYSEKLNIQRATANKQERRFAVLNDFEKFLVLRYSIYGVYTTKQVLLSMKVVTFGHHLGE